MRETSIEELNQFLLDGRRAAQYAWDHYDELASREKTYTLYGPENYGIGAGMPGQFIPQHARKLSKQTRRKNYMVYELDSEYALLRTISIQDYTKTVCTYHCFELDGVRYACSFDGEQRRFFRKEVLAIGYKDGRAQYLGFLREHSLIVQFFDYPSPEKMLVTTYSYSTVSKYSSHGYLVDHNAPIGALNSPVNCSSWEEELTDTDFSKWFS